MPVTHHPKADMTNALDEIATHIKQIKADFQDTERQELVEQALPKMRELWVNARNGDDPVFLNRLVTFLNGKKWTFNMEFFLFRQCTRQGYVYEITMKRM